MMPSVARSIFPAAIPRAEPCRLRSRAVAGDGIARRIVIVLHDFSGGGTERVAIRLANEWAASGRAVTLFCGTEEGCLRGLVADVVDVVAPPRPCRRSPISRLALARELAIYVARARPDVVFAPGNFHLPVLARFAARDVSGATTVGKLSNPLARSPVGPVRGAKGLGVRWLTGSIDCLVAMSPALRAEAQALLHRDDIALAWEPILVDRPLPRADGSGLRVLVVGRLEPQKNIALALEAFARSQHARTAELVILGEGRERAALTRHAQRLGIADRVRMPGHCADVMGALSTASLLLLTSRYEGYPAVVVEAIAAGVPVVATRCSPALDEIMGRAPHGAIVEAGAAAIATAIDVALTQARADPACPPNPSPMARHGVVEAAAAYLAVIDAAHARTVHRRVGTR